MFLGVLPVLVGSLFLCSCSRIVRLALAFGITSRTRAPTRIRVQDRHLAPRLRTMEPLVHASAPA